GSQTLYEIVESVDFYARPFTVVTQQGTYRAEAVIIATGVSTRWLGLESEERFRGKGVSACATCDGFFFRDKIVAVVGGGDTAIEDALFLTRFTSRVYVIHRRDELRASKIMANRAFQNEKVEVVRNSVVTEVLGDDEVGVTGIRLKDTVTEEEREMELDGLFVAIGHVPRTAIFKEFLETDEEGYLITDDVKTKIEGVFACGDIIDRVYRQAVTAAGSGCRAAIEVERWLEANQ
ncbi:MAG: FAD-dependent oxidoreductase, partial [Candidatus Krumholzibacteria bacterium]|nr:FAD-dependent oxidoreductase [Candidatus Krumholzibacteria bacterium]